MSIKKIALLFSTLFLIILSTATFASAFQLFTESASGLGDAYSGMAAIANDASTEFYNPAGMVRINRPEFSVSGVVISANTNFKGTATNFDGAAFTSSTNKAKPLGTNVIPAIHFVAPITNRLFFGFGITVPYGLETDYPKDGVQRYFATDSKIETINVNPNIAFKVNNKLSVAIGIDIQQLDAELDEQVDAAAVGGASIPNNDSTIKNSANDTNVGWNAGILYQFTPTTRLGFAYRSHVNHSPDGDMKVTYGAGLTNPQRTSLIQYGLRNGGVSTSITLPDTATLSLFHAFNKKWDGMATAVYTNWNRFKEIKLKFDTRLPNNVVYENFHGSWRYMIGTNYHYNNRWLFRAGAAYDESPVDSTDRTIRLPDADRVWVTLGAKYDITKKLSVDAGYAFIHIANGRLNQTKSNPNDQSTLTGTFKHSYANLIGAQVNWIIG